MTELSYLYQNGNLLSSGIYLNAVNVASESFLRKFLVLQY